MQGLKLRGFPASFFIFAALKTFFPGLNGLRAIAAITVVVLHINEFLPILFKQPPLFKGNDIAELSVILFFVLSGFLITYLLLVEKQKTGTIHLKTFYGKRILRIWPPYFIAVALAVLFYPLYKEVPGNVPLNVALPALLLILPNLNVVMGHMLTPLRPLWSIGVEEQFYLVWPLLIRTTKKPVIAILLFGIVYYMLAHNFRYVSSLPYGWIIEPLLLLSPMHIMAMGGVGAWLYFKQHPLLRVFYSPVLQGLALLLWAVSYVVFLPIPLRHEVFGVAFLIIILNTATNPKTLLSFEGKALNFLGRISYGIYVYHLFVAVVLYILFKHTTVNRWLISGGILTGTLVMACLSFFYVEKRVMTLRKRL